MKTYLPAYFLLFSSTIANLCYAQEIEHAQLFGSGFMTIGVGKMLGGTTANVGDFNCPCFVSDYAQAGIYDGNSSWQWQPDSKLGFQGGVRFQQWTITGQAIARGSNGGVDLSWLYGTYKFNDKFSIQIGRRRLPMFYYSDAQDIGISLPWTHLPTWLYGWQAVNYNGINLTFSDQFNGWTINSNLLAGNEHRKNSGYWQVFGNGRQSITDVHWTNIIGADLSLIGDNIEGRFVYLQSNTQDININQAWNYATLSYDPANKNAPVAKQQIYGLTVKAELNNWLFYNEFIHINHPGLTYRDFAQAIAVGYHLGKWTPMLTWGHYRGTVVTEDVLPLAPPSMANSQQTISLGFRYDLTNASAVKMQYDDTQDNSSATFNPRYGSSRLLTMSYDLMF